MREGWISLTRNQQDTLRVEAYKEMLHIQVSDDWLAPLLNECQCDHFLSIHLPIRQLNSATLHLTNLLNQEVQHQNQLSSHAVEIVKIVCIHLLRFSSVADHDLLHEKKIELREQ